ncbi:Transmembrane emp24 domain-containing protein eca [Nesidiocoris tenuis]|uniref:Transmembrane emp24 domain-containing protein eca n=1 Tax=Nesidiocoris tenuis TaxID=355587 RepID=A0ABN7AU49_9HEMI|nr:Transmembrane emp24 domain-containing protein eca [Nesidiocoris tenuis]
MKNLIFSLFGTCLMAAVAVDAIMFNLPVSLVKCIKNEGGKGALVVGVYNVTQIDGQQVDILVTDSKRHVLASPKNVEKGRFTFVTETEDLFEVCFTSRGRVFNRDASHTVEMILKRGVEARSHDELAKAEKLKPLEKDIVYAEQLAESVVHEFGRMKAREEVLSDTNESTLNRVLYLGIFNVIWLVFTTACQLKYLHSYFKAKRLVE